MKKILKPIKVTQSGMSLVSLLVGMFVTTATLMVSSSIMNSSSNIQAKLDYVTDMTKSHMLSVTLLRSITNVKKALEIGSPVGANDHDPAVPSTNDELRRCFLGTGTTCTSQSAATQMLQSGALFCSQVPVANWRPFPNLNGVQMNGNYSRTKDQNCTGSDCEMNKSVVYCLECSSNAKCDNIHIQASDSYVGTRSFMKSVAPSVTAIRYSGKDLVGNTTYSYACAADGKTIGGFDTATNAAECIDLPSPPTCENSSSRDLLLGFGSSQCTTNKVLSCNGTSSSYGLNQISFNTAGLETSACYTAPPPPGSGPGNPIQDIITYRYIELLTNISVEKPAVKLVLVIDESATMKQNAFPKLQASVSQLVDQLIDTNVEIEPYTTTIYSDINTVGRNHHSVIGYADGTFYHPNGSIMAPPQLMGLGYGMVNYSGAWPASYERTYRMTPEHFNRMPFKFKPDMTNTERNSEKTRLVN